MLLSVWSDRQVLKAKVVMTGLPKLIQSSIFPTTELQYDHLRLSLQFDELLIDWCDNSLVYVEVVESPNSIATAAAIDLGEINRSNKDAEDPVKRLGALMAKWNIDYVYDNEKHNFMHFIYDIARELDLQIPSMSTPHGDFMFTVRKGKLPRPIPPLKEIDPTAPDLFPDHASLDIYSRDLFTRHSERGDIVEGRVQFKSEHPDHFRLLRLFDLVFWVIQQNNSEMHPPAESGCPFPATSK
eukprot:TRINITY_DN1384_c0_g1_i2.p1 TRINITY_DN1384_c0_g1~~TRINITY_DN1384_c0_g1_i2.p1  ORF type:complete len:241 (+),score=54.98 TRINITY_DN1384_c0_g1_i2:524-1246(+)